MERPAIDNGIYDREAQAWWDEDSHLHLLAGMIPCRLGYLEEIRPEGLEGLRTLDLGCGGGLFSEALARRGCRVVGVDPSAASLEVARSHAEGDGLEIDYRCGSGEGIPAEDACFELVCCCDVLEHVDDLEATVAECARVLAPGGVLFFDTINRSLLSRLLITGLLQDWPLLGVMPEGLHVWHKFIKPGELEHLLRHHGLEPGGMAGMSPDLGPVANLRRLGAVVALKRGTGSWKALGETLRFQRGPMLVMNYMGWARKG
jgi:2-polyprenyl-6-hydroxyphenyl methylase/3-demethylubiquinone-9 3-methyltransferase